MSNYKKYSTRHEPSVDSSIRLSESPILHPENFKASIKGFKVVGVLNPTYINTEGQDYLIVRIDESPENKLDDFIKNTPLGLDSKHERICEKYGPYVSHFRSIPFNNDLEFQIEKNLPLVNNQGEIIYHVEDPRMSTLNDKTYILYSEITEFGSLSYLARFKPPNYIENENRIFGPDHKHSVLFPIEFNNNIIALTRPLTRIALETCGVWSFESYDLKHWGNPEPFLIPRKEYWDSKRTGIAASPIRLKDFWLILYYGVDKEDSYHLGITLSKYDSPLRIVYRSAIPILSPSLKWELEGRRADTVFSGGLKYNGKSNEILIFYGAADTNIGVASYNLNELNHARS